MYIGPRPAREWLGSLFSDLYVQEVAGGGTGSDAAHRRLLFIQSLQASAVRSTARMAGFFLRAAQGEAANLTLAVASEMHVIVFGVYTPNYENERDAFLFIFNQFAVGAEFDANSGEMKNSEVPPSQPPPQSPQPNPVSPMPDVA